MDKIKHFFEQKKAKVKFALMGEGTKLSAGTGKPSADTSTSSASQRMRAADDFNAAQGRLQQSDDARRAGEAAMARLSTKNNPHVPSASATYMRLKGQIEAEMKRENAASKVPMVVNEQKEVVKDGPRMLEVDGIYFVCPLIGPGTASWNEMKDKIATFLEEQLCTQEPAMAAALMINSLNSKDQEKVQKCIEILTKYLENIIGNPSEDKFSRIRIQNKALQEKVLSVRGGTEFLQAVGFEQIQEQTENGTEPFLFMPESRRIPAELKEKLDVLTLAEPIVPILDRGVKVFFPSANAGRFGDLPDEFYAITKEDIKKEQQAKQEEAEKLGILRTKAMRERDAQRELRRYRFALIRFRFPDQTNLQGTFWSTESAKNLIEFVKEHVEPEWAPFSLSCRTSQGLSLQLTEETSGTIAEHGLCPSSLVNVVFDADLMEQCKKEQIPPPRLKSSTLELIQPLP